jgi:hypothetical protein
MDLVQKQVEFTTCGQGSIVHGSDRRLGFCRVCRRLDKRVLHLEAARTGRHVIRRLLDRCGQGFTRPNAGDIRRR